MYNKNRKSLCFFMLKPWWAGNKTAIKYLLPNHYQWVSDFKYGWIIYYIAYFTLRSSSYEEYYFSNMLFNAFKFIYLSRIVCGPGARPCLFARCVKKIFSYKLTFSIINDFTMTYPKEIKWPLGNFFLVKWHP